MTANEIRVGDVGTELIATITDSGTAVDISGANTTTSRIFHLENSGGTVQSLTASFVSDSGTSGVLAFTSTTATFTVEGTHKLQAKVIVGSKTFHSDIYQFTVYRNLQ